MDALKQKSGDSKVASSGHLIAKAIETRGIDTIFVSCGRSIAGGDRSRKHGAALAL